VSGAPTPPAGARARRAAAFAGTLLCALPGCGDSQPPAAGPAPAGAAAAPSPAAVLGRFHFSEMAAECGLNMVTTNGRSPATQILEVKGGGLALLDRDDDGDLDVFVPNGATLESPLHGPGCKLFDNDGPQRAADGEAVPRFHDATAAAGLHFDGWGMGTAVGDVEGDGFDDLFVAAWGPDALLHNDGGRSFTDVTAAAGVADTRWSTGCAFGDVDGDGDLDLFVATYLVFDPARPPPGDTFKGVPVFGGPFGLPGEPDLLYANRGDGTFEDVSAACGIEAVPPSHGLGVTIVDIDLDGRQEIFVGNDSQPDFLFDDAEGAAASAGCARPLADRGMAAGLAVNGDGRAQATMGIAVLDVDGDGWPDVFTTNFSSDTNTLHVNRGGRFFEDRTSVYGLGAPSRPYVKWAALACDFDADGQEDLLIFNGHTYAHATLASMDSEAFEPPQLYARNGARFVLVTDPAAGAWLAEKHMDRSAALGDLDGDGDPDVVVTELNAPVRVLINDGPHGRALTVALHDGRPGAKNPRGLGSRVGATLGGRTQWRWILSGTAYLSASEAAAHFGFGPGAPEETADLLITWPDGHEQHVSGAKLGARTTVERDG
jgi:hypothetical protein